MHRAWPITEPESDGGVSDSCVLPRKFSPYRACYARIHIICNQIYLLIKYDCCGATCQPPTPKAAIHSSTITTRPRRTSATYCSVTPIYKYTELREQAQMRTGISFLTGQRETASPKIPPARRTATELQGIILRVKINREFPLCSSARCRRACESANCLVLLVAHDCSKHAPRRSDAELVLHLLETLLGLLRVQLVKRLRRVRTGSNVCWKSQICVNMSRKYE